MNFTQAFIEMSNGNFVRRKAWDFGGHQKYGLGFNNGRFVSDAWNNEFNILNAICESNVRADDWYVVNNGV